MGTGLNKEEQEIMDLLVEAHNKFLALPRTHSSEMPDWVLAFHSLQNILGWRTLRRVWPNEFRGC